MSLFGLLANMYLLGTYRTKASLAIKKKPFYKNIGLWVRYVDDVFCIWNADASNVTDFQLYLNNIGTQQTQL